MKKLLLSAILAVGTLVPMGAQNLMITSFGEEIPNGSTYKYSGYVWEEYDPGFYSVLTVNPELYLTSDVDATVTIHTLSEIPVGICAGGLCVRGKDITKDNVKVTAGAPLNLIFDWEEEFYGDTSTYEIPLITTSIEVWYNDNPANKYVITVEMGGVNASAGVEGIEVCADSVVFHGNSLSYDLAQASQLSLYSLSGKTVLTRGVSGSGSVSLDGLSKGIYLYRLTGKNGKVIKTSKIIIK